MKTRLLAALAATLSLASCATGPSTPQEAYLNRYAAAETVAMNCGAYGGYSSVVQMKADADSNLGQARALGATDKDVQKARNNINGRFFAMAALTNPPQACAAMLNNLAWAGTSKPVITPKKKVKPTT